MRPPSKRYFFVHLLVIVPVAFLLAAGMRSTYRDFQHHEEARIASKNRSTPPLNEDAIALPVSVLNEIEALIALSDE